MSEQLYMNEREADMVVAERVLLLPAGKGVIEPTQKYTHEEVLRASDEAQKPVADPHVVCMDERESVGEKQPVREKVAGGNLTTGLFAAAAAGWSGFTEFQKHAGPEAMAEEVADNLVNNGEALGAHRHNTVHKKNGTGCGAVDKSPNTLINTVEHAFDDDVVEHAKIDLGEHFNPDYWQGAYDGYKRMAEDPKWQNWRTSRVQEIVEEKDGVVEVLNGEKDISKDPDNSDPENERHGHWAEGARINSTPGVSNDRDNAEIPLFQIDLAPIIRIAQKMATTTEEFGRLLHAEAMFQYMTAYTLTKNQRILR